jgi:ATP-dependent phosphofructokinase / diphosphate-dependent phosphofructokinase
MTKKIGILTAGGDAPGLNAVLRGVGKAAHAMYGMNVIGFQDGFSGMVSRNTLELEGSILSNILTSGGTILGTSRDRPQAMLVDGRLQDNTAGVIQTYRDLALDALVCLGGNDAQESAFHLMQNGLNVITLPVTIDNDLVETDTSVGFDTALEVAAEAIDRLHTTASSHHRIIIVEVMGKQTGWLTLGAGIAGGADVILIPELPYDERSILKAIEERSQAGKRFSIVAVSEGAISKDTLLFFEQAKKTNQRLRSGPDLQKVASRLDQIEQRSAGNTIHLANQLEKKTGMDPRITILGYLQRGGTPSATDRVLATQLGTACAAAIEAGRFGVMLGVHGANRIEPVPLEQVSGKFKTVPLDYPWINGARMVGTNLGD